jgi:hypothetical protein
MEIKTVQLEKMKLIAMQYISEELAEYFSMPPKLDIGRDVSFVYDNLVLRLVQEVYGRQVERVDVRYPSDWWQAFKERWFPAWAKKRWPVHYKTTALEAKELYPKLAVAIPDQEPILTLHRWDTEYLQ